MKNSTLSVLVATVLGTTLAGSANAFTISSGNATVSGDRLGLSEWSQNGTNQLASQTWWFNASSTAGSTPFNYELVDYDHTPTETSTATSASVGYANILGFDVQVDYSISGGVNTSTLGESVTITNTTNSAATFTLFQFTDFDLGGYQPYDSLLDNVGNGTDSFNYGMNDTVTQVTGNYVTQSNGAMTVLEQAATVPYPTLTSIGQANALDNALWDGTVMGTANGDSFTGDAAWIWQYTFNIAANSSASIGKTMIMETVVPVPAAAWLFGTGLIGLVGVARRRA